MKIGESSVELHVPEAFHIFPRALRDKFVNIRYLGAESDATKAIEFNGADSKALFRRALAREQLDNVGPAFRDAQEANRLSPKDA